jgi:hypothetical protein
VRCTRCPGPRLRYCGAGSLRSNGELNRVSSSVGRQGYPSLCPRAKLSLHLPPLTTHPAHLQLPRWLSGLRQLWCRSCGRNLSFPGCPTTRRCLRCGTQMLLDDQPQFRPYHRFYRSDPSRGCERICSSPGLDPITRLPLGGGILIYTRFVFVSRHQNKGDDNRARGTRMANQVWSPAGVQTPNFVALASTWRPN